MRSIVLVVVVVGFLGACTLDDSSVEEDVSSVEQQVAGQAIVSLTWDDTLGDQQTAVDLLDAHGLRGTFYVNSGRLGGTGYLSASQLLGWQQQGHEIAGHTKTHVDVTTLAPDEARRQICDDRVALLGRGFVVTSFAYPFGASNALAEQIADECGYNSARGVGDVNNPIPPTDPFDLHTPPSVKPETTLAQLEGYVTAAEPAGRWVPIVFHHVCDGCASNAVSPATLDAFLGWLEANDKVVRTVDEVIGGDVQPGVPAPPSGSNLLVNPSLEVDANGDAVPDCWQRGGTGTSTATYTLTGNAHDGAVAQRIDVTSVTAGAARRLVSKQDTGACAPAAQPGHQFRVSAFYLANAQPRFTAYYRAASGAWTYWTQGPLLPSSASYVAASFVTPPLPAGASAVSVGLSLYSVGSVTMDQFGLVETDTTPPTAAVSSPAAGAHVTGIAPIVAATSDNVGVVRVRFYLDGVQLGTRTVMPFKWNWNTATTTTGSHTVAVQAEDAAGNATRSPNVPVTVD
ncbi:MAG TPA: polysaccharide deacetylase family protein [Kofleriaceae bacterium]|nr:polysaccharide deacetylase family protein [Kofleriaceae bacterium]